ncbi:MAG: hypothetical protein WED08_02665, partial [Patescibacteria group bacterium]
SFEMPDGSACFLAMLTSLGSYLVFNSRVYRNPTGVGIRLLFKTKNGSAAPNLPYLWQKNLPQKESEPLPKARSNC